MSGNFNIDMGLPSRQQLDLNSLLDSSGFHNVIETPTRITGTSSTTPDLFSTNVNREHVTSGVLILDISDHFPIFFIYKQISQTRHNQ